MLSPARTFAAVSFALASLFVASSNGTISLLFWMVPGLAATGWVQWVAWRGTGLEQARLWYATPPLWLLSAVPVVMASPLVLTDRILSVGGLVLGALVTAGRSVAHERLVDLLHGPAVHSTLA